MAKKGIRKESVTWFGPELGTKERELVLKVLESNYLNDGDVTRAFEAKIAALIGVKYCIGVTSGTAALALALMGLGIGVGDEVIVPDFTFIATANAVRLTGAKVKLVDIEPKRFTIDIEKVMRAINKHTRAIIPVDVNGRGAEYAALRSIAREKGLFLICDSTEALGSKYKGRYLGTFGDAGCFSFSANKTITTGQGGMVATDNKGLYRRILELKDQGRRFQGTGGDDLHPVLGYNFKLTNLQAAVGLGQLKMLKRRLSKAKERDRWYVSLLDGCPGVTLPSVNNYSGEITQWSDILIEDRKKAESAMKSHNIGYRAFWHPLHRQKPYKASDSDFKNSISVSRRGLWLPSPFSLTRKQAETTAKVIKKCLI